MFLGLHIVDAKLCIVGTMSCYWSLPLSLIKLALQVYCNRVLKIIHCAGSGGVGLFYRKVFPHRQICVLCVFLFPSTFLLVVVSLHCFESVSVKLNKICIILPLRN